MAERLPPFRKRGTVVPDQFGFTVYSGAGSGFSGLNLAAFEVTDLRAGQWTDDGDYVLSVMDELLPYVELVCGPAAELIRLRRLLPFGGIYVATGFVPGMPSGGPSIPSKLFQVSEVAEELFLGALRAVNPGRDIGLFPRIGAPAHRIGVRGFSGIYPGLYMHTKRNGWVYNPGAHNVHGETMIAPQLLERPVRLAFTAVHESGHIGKPTPDDGTRPECEIESIKTELDLGRELLAAIRRGVLAQAHRAEVEQCTAAAEAMLRRHG